METIYCGAAPLPTEIWGRWNLDPVLLLALAASGFGLHAAGDALSHRRRRMGVLALGVLVVAFVSPLCALSSALFAARVVHHVLLIAVAAPLLAAAFPAGRQAPLALSLAVSSAVLWFWHLPAAYDLALANVAVYWAMQLSLLGSFIWFWRAVRAPGRSHVEAVTAVIAGFAQMGLLGAILTFAPDQLYAAHALAPMAWGLTPLGDQQLGGLIMWVPAGLPYAVMALLVARGAWESLSESAA